MPVNCPNPRSGAEVPYVRSVQDLCQPNRRLGFYPQCVSCVGQQEEALALFLFACFLHTVPVSSPVRMFLQL